jgi:hypothetical protein
MPIGDLSGRMERDQWNPAGTAVKLLELPISALNWLFLKPFTMMGCRSSLRTDRHQFRLILPSSSRPLKKICMAGAGAADIRFYA